MAATLGFYRTLGFEIPASADTEPHVELTPSPGVLIAWDTEETIRGFDPSWVAPTGSHRAALAFSCESPLEVDTTYATLVEAGYHGHVAPWDAFWGQRYATLLDPDGTSVDLFAAL